MTGREERKSNDLFFTCSLIDYIARKTQNKRADVVTTLGRDSIAKIYELADVYHSDNIERVSDDLIESAHIPTGCFDNLSNSRYSIPSHWDIGKVYKRLILGNKRWILWMLYSPPISLLSATSSKISTAASIMMRRRIS